MNDSPNNQPLPPCFTPFEGKNGQIFSPNTEGVVLPAVFTFPFNYTPHPLSLLAAHDLQQHIQTQTEWQHNFGLAGESNGLGKMFGVLVVQTAQGELGYLAAFSGKLAGNNHHKKFVPPVFDILDDAGFFRKEEAEISQINREIENLSQNQTFLSLQIQLKTETEQSLSEIKNLKDALKTAKTERDERRKKAQIDLSEADFSVFEEVLNKESADFYYQVKDLNRTWRRRLAATQTQLDEFESKMGQLKEMRRTMSAQLQQRIFDNYFFLNIKGEKKSLGAIFSENTDATPPAGAGECAAPKLLQYAFLHNLKPIAMAEFWWGQSPSSEIRKHGHFYPACKSKCEPILGHQLKGIATEPDPLTAIFTKKIALNTVFEDDHLLVVNKPADFLSVPGKTSEESIFNLIKNAYPLATGPLMVHRLDMSTSGLMVIAKTKEVHQNLQSQFLKRQVKKRYAAILDGILTENEGKIDLPLRVNLEDRPRQLVCFNHGKPAQTRWQVVERREKTTKIHFFPITGRTHQLRVHAAHPLGLNMPILGDELYGKRADRLYLHAEFLEFLHPQTAVLVQIEVLA